MCGGVIHNLAVGLVPTGSSETLLEGEFSGATDGSTHQRNWWMAAPGDYPGVLVLDLGAPAFVTSMRITAAGMDNAFQTLRIYRSDDGREWTAVRAEKTPAACVPGSTTEYRGWPEAGRYVAIHMEDRCTGVHGGRFAIAEWGVFGFYEQQMALQFRRKWPQCEDFGPCFAYADLEEAKATCLANERCDGFSFSAGAIGGGRGSGCYKTACRAEAPRTWSRQGFGRGTYGYWVKRHGCEVHSHPAYVDTASGLEVCGP